MGAQNSIGAEYAAAIHVCISEKSASLHTIRNGRVYLCAVHRGEEHFHQIPRTFLVPDAFWRTLTEISRDSHGAAHLTQNFDEEKNCIEATMSMIPEHVLRFVLVPEETWQIHTATEHLRTIWSEFERRSAEAAEMQRQIAELHRQQALHQTSYQAICADIAEWQSRQVTRVTELERKINTGGVIISTFKVPAWKSVTTLMVHLEGWRLTGSHVFDDQLKKCWEVGICGSAIVIWKMYFDTIFLRRAATNMAEWRDPQERWSRDHTNNGEECAIPVQTWVLSMMWAAVMVQQKFTSIIPYRPLLRVYAKKDSPVEFVLVRTNKRLCRDRSIFIELSVHNGDVEFFWDDIQIALPGRPTNVLEHLASFVAE